MSYVPAGNLNPFVSPRRDVKMRNGSMAEPKYAPANAAGDKPYVVEQSGWGRKRTKVVYAPSVTEARWRAFGRQGVGEYITGCRRATPADMPNPSRESGDGL